MYLEFSRTGITADFLFKRACLTNETCRLVNLFRAFFGSFCCLTCMLQQVCPGGLFTYIYKIVVIYRMNHELTVSDVMCESSNTSTFLVSRIMHVSQISAEIHSHLSGLENPKVLQRSHLEDFIHVQLVVNLPVFGSLFLLCIYLYYSIWNSVLHVEIE